MATMTAPLDPAREISIAAAADLHGHLPQVGPCDLLLLAGDLAPYAIERDPERCRTWFATEFAAWLEDVAPAETIAIAGNHDFWAQDLPAGVHRRLFDVDWTFLQDAETTTHSGLRVYGSPWTRAKYDSAFEAPPQELARIWQAIPEDLDVLVVHGPPHGHGDQLAEADGVSHMGTAELLAAVERTQPRLVIYGHAHQGYGYRAALGASARTEPGTRLANVSVRTDYLGGLHRVSELRLPAR
jgi:Icc-related predicted phosphoesterase